MSAHLATYHSLNLGGRASDLQVVAINCGKNHPQFGVQFLVGAEYCALDGSQVAHLVDLLQKRLAVAPPRQRKHMPRSFRGDEGAAVVKCADCGGPPKEQP